MEKISFELWAGGRMSFSGKDKRECLETVRTIMHISATVRAQSVAYLDNKTAMINDIFLKKAIELIINATDPDSVAKIMYNYIVAGDYRGKELLRRILIIDGLTAITQGHLPEHIKEKLASYFGEDFISEFEKINAAVPIYESPERFLNIIKEAKYPEGTNLLESSLKNMSGFSIQALLKHLTPNDIIISMRGSSEIVARQFLDNMSKKSGELIMDDYFYADNVKTEHILDTQNKVLNKIAELKEKGEVV